MTAMIRPTLLLRMDLDENVYSEDVVAEIKRSYSYVAPTVIESHATKGEAPENTLGFVVKIRKPFWLSSDEGSDELWNDVMLKWFENMFTKTSTTVVTYNTARLEKGEQKLDYSWLEIDLGDRIVAIKLNADSSIPLVATDLLAQARTFTQEGKWPQEGVSRISIPSRASFVAQTADVVEAEKTIPLTEYAQEYVADEPAILPVDYTVWGIEYGDGSERAFDSEAGALIA